MIYVLHLPVFPEGSPVIPDAITDLLFDNQMSDDIAHIVLASDDREKVVAWTTEFLQANPQIPQDEVTLTNSDEEVQLSDLSCFTAFKTFPFKSDLHLHVFYLPLNRIEQKVVELPVTA